MIKTYALILLVSMALLGATSGCSGIAVPMDAPHVTIASLGVVDANLFEQRYRIRLRIQNPNPVNLAITGMEYQIEINERTFARGVSDQTLTIPRYGMKVVEVEAVSHLSDVVGQLLALEAGPPDVFRYRVIGTINLRKPERQLPFEHQGEITLPGRPVGTSG